MREARLRELRSELLNSQRLAAHFDDNPADLALLKHDAPLAKANTAPHLKHLPAYLRGGGLRRIERAPAAAHAAATDAGAAPHAGGEGAAAEGGATGDGAEADAAPRGDAPSRKRKKKAAEGAEAAVRSCERFSLAWRSGAGPRLIHSTAGLPQQGPRSAAAACALWHQAE